MAFTENTKGSTASNGGSTSVTVALTGIASGDLVVAYCKWEGADTTITVADSGATDNFTAATKTSHSNSDLHGQFFYFLSATQTGSITYTMTLGASRSWKKFFVTVITPDGGDTVSFDVEATGQGSGSNPASGTFSPSGSDIVTFGGYSEYGNITASAWQVNSSATGVVVLEEGDGSEWYKIDTSGFTSGTVDMTITSSIDWVCNGISFDSVAGGGGGTTLHQTTGYQGMNRMNGAMR